MAVREVVIKCKRDISTYIHQHFPCLRSINEPFCCKFLLECPEGVQLPVDIEEEFNKDFKTYFSQGRYGHNTDGNTECNDIVFEQVEKLSIEKTTDQCYSDSSNEPPNQVVSSDNIPLESAQFQHTDEIELNENKLVWIPLSAEKSQGSVVPLDNSEDDKFITRVNETSWEQEKESDGSNLAIDIDHESTPSSLKLSNQEGGGDSSSGENKQISEDVPLGWIASDLESPLHKMRVNETSSDQNKPPDSSNLAVDITSLPSSLKSSDQEGSVDSSLSEAKELSDPCIPSNLESSQLTAIHGGETELCQSYLQPFIHENHEQPKKDGTLNAGSSTMGVSASNNTSSYHDSNKKSIFSKPSTSMEPLTDPTTVHVTSRTCLDRINSKSSYYSEHKEKMKRRLVSQISVSTYSRSKKQPKPETYVLEEKLNSSWIKILYDFFHSTSPSGTLIHTNEKESTDSCENISDGSDKAPTEHLNNFQHCSCPYEGFDLCKECHSFWPYIEHHLRDIKCQKNICTLWELCLRKKQYGIFEFAPERLIIFSDDKNRIGTITHDYDNYRTKPEIGMGGYGRVFEHSISRETSGSDIKVAVKEEMRSSSLISDLKRFISLLDVDHPNVLHFQEYVIGHCINDAEDTHRPPLLLIMKHYDQRGLNEPFKNDQKCLLDYMAIAQDNAKYIFRNLLFIALDLFSALEYFAKKGLVHRDVKRSNILLTLTCSCPSAVVCTCYGIDGRGGGTALLSDFDLVEAVTTDGTWARLRDSEPAGTRGMKAPELFFVNENGQDMFTAKADIWSAFVTIMHVLLGRDVNDEPLQKIKEFFQYTTSGIYSSLQEIDSCIKELQKHRDGCINENHTIFDNIKVLKYIRISIKQLCRFHGVRQPPSKKSIKEQDNYCPAAELLTAVHGVSPMPQICIDKVPHVFQSSNPLQDSFKELWSIIQEGMNFHPEDRPNAEQVVSHLKDSLSKLLNSSIFIQYRNS